MADSNLASLSEAKYILPTDLIYAVIDPSGTPTDKKAFASTITGGAFVIVDTTVSDHANAAVEGTIAWALAQADSAGGGVVKLGPGTFTTTSATLTVPDKVSLIGAGRGATTIDCTLNSVTGVTYTAGSEMNSIIRDFGVNMSATAAALTAAIKCQGSYGSAENLMCLGGSANSWGMIFDNFYNYNVRNIRINESGVLGVTSGILMHNSTSNFNIGDSNFTGIHMRVRGSAVGFHMQSDAVGAGTASVNDIVFTQIQILGQSATETAFIMDTSPRNTFIQCDYENVGTTGTISATCANCTFINNSTWGSGTLTDSSSTSKHLNGIGAFAALNNL